jgi:hypothetical protein
MPGPPLLGAVLVLALMRPFKAILALEYKHRRNDFGERA